MCLHRLNGASRPVQADPFGRSNSALDGNGHVNHLNWLIGEPL